MTLDMGEHEENQQICDVYHTVMCLQVKQLLHLLSFQCVCLKKKVAFKGFRCCSVNDC